MNKAPVTSFVLLWMVFGVGALASGAGASEPIVLWPNGAPGEIGVVGKEHDTTAATNRFVAGKRVIRLSNVSIPTITLYRPSKHKDTGAAVLVCPGGAYHFVVTDLEGTEICQWLNSIGVTGVLLKYRVPTRPGDDTHLLPLQDAQRALGLVRFHANDWNLDPKRIGIIGFSAGGHLTAHLSNNYERRSYESMDEADQASCRPDFAMLIYPAYLVPKNPKTNNYALSPEFRVTANTPPTFLMQTEDDGLGPENCLFIIWR